jgi:hypothetical protein
MDCLRSGRDCVPGVGAALAGRLGGAASVPKKSSPSSESAGFDCFGGAASVFGGGLEDIGGPDVALGGGPASSANRSGCGALLTCDGPPAGLGAVRCEVDLSIACFSFTKLNGTSSSPSASSVEGSGIGPSITHLFDSYFVRMKFSIFDSDGTCPGANFASQYLFALEFPHFRTLCSCSSVHASRSTDLTLLMCVPIPRCIPEHRMQTKIPKFQLAHRGSVNRNCQS